MSFRLYTHDLTAVTSPCQVAPKPVLLAIDYVATVAEGEPVATVAEGELVPGAKERTTASTKGEGEWTPRLDIDATLESIIWLLDNHRDEFTDPAKARVAWQAWAGVSFPDLSL